MEDVKQVYPGCIRKNTYAPNGEYFSSPGDYEPLLRSFGHEILLKIDDDDYQGDSRLILKDGERYGLLIFGWGSCSGCDALQACESYEDISKLRNQLQSQIIWKESPSEMLTFLKDRDWKKEYSWRDGKTKDFVAQAIALLENLAPDSK